MAPGDDETRGGDPAGGDEPTRELPDVPAGGAGDRCTACGAPMVHDQRYCVECGERRGQSRLPVTRPATEVPATRRVRRTGPPRQPRVGSGTTLVAGVGVLLLAIGLGFLIGRTGTKTTTTQAAATTPQVITVQGGVAATAPTRTTAAKLTKKSKSKLKAAAAASAPPSAAVQQKATEAAGKVLGNSKNLPPPTSTVGQTCASSKAGCSSGKFDGNFFGP